MVSVIAVHLCDRTHQELSFKTKRLITNKAADVMWLYARLVYVRITLLILLFKMTECSKLFRCLGEKYGQLYRSSFNADPVSLQNIETYPFIQLLFEMLWFLFHVWCLIPSTKSEYNEVLDIRNHILRPRKSFNITKPFYKRTHFASSLGLSLQAREKS